MYIVYILTQCMFFTKCCFNCNDGNFRLCYKVFLSIARQEIPVAGTVTGFNYCSYFYSNKIID